MPTDISDLNFECREDHGGLLSADQELRPESSVEICRHDTTRCETRKATDADSGLPTNEIGDVSDTKTSEVETVSSKSPEPLNQVSPERECGADSAEPVVSNTGHLDGQAVVKRDRNDQSRPDTILRWSDESNGVECVGASTCEATSCAVQFDNAVIFDLDTDWPPVI